MNEKKRMVLLPFDNESYPMIVHDNSFINEFSIVGMFSPKGWLDQYTTNDEMLKNSCKNSIILSDDFEKLLSICEYVLFMDPQKSLDYESYIWPKMRIAINLGKHIICTMKLDKTKYSQLKYECERKGVHLFMYNNLNSFDEDKFINTHNFLNDIKVPVIFVCGNGERTNKFHIQLSLRRKLHAEGYRVAQIGSRNYCEILGFHSFPSFMYSGRLTETEKILSFNHFVKQLEISEKPEVIVIGIPGGIMPFNNILTNHFGIFAYEISQAVKPDAAIFSVLYENYKPYFFDLMSETVKYKLGIDISCFNLANTQVDWDTSKQRRSFSYSVFNSTFIDEKICKLGSLRIPIYNILNTKQCDEMYEYVLSSLGVQDAEYI